MSSMVYVWLGAFAVFVVVEMATVNLVSIWFAAGSVAALIAALLGAQIWVQILLFVAVSGIVLACVRPFAKKLLKVKKQPTNADRVIGMVGRVSEDIDGVAGTGAVFIDGKTWSARADGRIGKGELVRAVEIRGVKLIVEPAEGPARTD